MPIYLDTRGNSTLGIGICGRCSQKFPLGELMSDPNAPGLMVCAEDKDQLDPYRLPCRQMERIPLTNQRPDVPLTDRANMYIYAFQYFGITEVHPTLPWQANTDYRRGDSMTPLNVDLDTTQLPQPYFVCIVPGVSGATPPAFPKEAGQLIGNWNYLTDDNGPTVHQAAPVLTDDGEAIVTDLFGGDGTVGWICMGPYLLGRTTQ